MARVLITGGAGFIGTNLAKELIRRNHEVTVVDDFSSGLRSNVEDLSVKVYEKSILDISSIEHEVSSVDHIFHLAARGSVPRSVVDPRGTFQVNTNGTYEILEISRKFKIPITFSSSSSVYGANKESPKNERSWTQPTSPYAASKLAAESLVLSFGNTYSIPHKVFRFFNVFGPLQRPNHLYSAVIPKWIWALLHDQPIVLEGDGYQSRDFTYIDDVVRVLADSLVMVEFPSSVVNLAFGMPLTLNELLKLLEDFFPQPRVLKAGPRVGDIRNSLNQPSLLNLHFPEVVPRDFRDSIRSTINWLSENRTKIQKD
jgi:UDP-glucose 4-epimerase